MCTGSDSAYSVTEMLLMVQSVTGILLLRATTIHLVLSILIDEQDGLFNAHAYDIRFRYLRAEPCAKL